MTELLEGWKCEYRGRIRMMATGETIMWFISKVDQPYVSQKEIEECCQKNAPFMFDIYHLCGDHLQMVNEIKKSRESK